MQIKIGHHSPSPPYKLKVQETTVKEGIIQAILKPSVNKTEDIERMARLLGYICEQLAEENPDRLCEMAYCVGMNIVSDEQQADLIEFYDE